MVAHRAPGMDALRAAAAVLCALLGALAMAGAAGGPARWGILQPAASLLIRAEDFKKLDGKMVLAKDLDNDKVLDKEGRRAQVSFVWVVDKTCEKGQESLHKAFFELQVPKSGTYYPWSRVWWTDPCGNSIAISLQREGEKRHEFLITDGTEQWWHWLPLAGPKGIALKEGVYTVVVENREDGARLSRILFATRDYETYKPEAPEG